MKKAQDYKKWTEYKVRLKSLGITIVDLIPLFDEAPGTIGGRLNGYAPFPLEMRHKLDFFLKEREEVRGAA